MKSLRVAIFAAMSGVLFSSVGHAASGTYVFDKTHTQVRFCWSHFGISTMCAYFKDYDGQLVFDAANPDKSKLEITFKTDSVETVVPTFNDHMKGENLFDTKKFPTASFKSTKIEKTGDKTGKVTGDLTIKGVTKPVTLDVTLNFSGAHPFSKAQTLGFGAKTQLKRSEFNAGYAAPAVSDEVTLDIQTEMNVKKS